MADSAANTQGSKLRLFNRNVELTLYTQAASGTGFFDTSNEALVITDLRVQFEIKKSLGKEPNNCTVTISNLAKETRGKLERKPLYAILRAGHDGVLRPLFRGSVQYAKSNLKSPDWETKLQIADGGRAYAHARMNRSYAPPITVRQILTDLAGTMGLPLPADIAALDELKTSLAGGMSAYGPTRDILTKVLSPLGYSWSVQDGRLQILKSGLPNARTAWVIDEDSGLIGSPEASIPHKPGDPSELSLDVLLYPEIGPGDLIQVTSRAYAGGFFRVNDISHKGDTHGNDWTTSIKATPRGSALPSKGRGKR